jgi:hypothetical protein
VGLPVPRSGIPGRPLSSHIKTAAIATPPIISVTVHAGVPVAGSLGFCAPVSPILSCLPGARQKAPCRTRQQERAEPVCLAPQSRPPTCLLQPFRLPLPATSQNPSLSVIAAVSDQNP